MGATLKVRPHLHENDRSATGYLPAAAFEAMAEAFFADPDHSQRGWGTAHDAQARILRETRPALAVEAEGDVLIVGHGAVGSLLYCALSGRPVSRQHDQPAGGGNFWEFERAHEAVIRGWTPIEVLQQSGHCAPCRPRSVSPDRR